MLHWEESGVNSVLETDIRSVQRVFGENSIDYRLDWEEGREGEGGEEGGREGDIWGRDT